MRIQVDLADYEDEAKITYYERVYALTWRTGAEAGWHLRCTDQPEIKISDLGDDLYTAIGRVLRNLDDVHNREVEGCVKCDNEPGHDGQHVMEGQE